VLASSPSVKRQHRFAKGNEVNDSKLDFTYRGDFGPRTSWGGKRESDAKDTAPVNEKIKDVYEQILDIFNSGNLGKVR